MNTQYMIAFALCLALGIAFICWLSVFVIARCDQAVRDSKLGRNSRGSCNEEDDFERAIRSR